MAKEKKEKKSKEDKKKEKEEKKKEKKEKKGKKGKKEEEEKPEKGKKGKKDKKDKKDKKAKKEKPGKEEKKKKKKRKKGEPEEPETEETLEAPEEKGKKGKKDKKKSGKKGSKKKSEEEPEQQPKKKPKKAPAPKEGEEAPEGMEGVEGAEGEEAVAPLPPMPAFNLSWAGLHLLGMGFMLCDSLWITVFPADDWLTCFGRMSYPIFAFLLVEGFFHTENLWRYLRRLVCLALCSEIPFNLLYGGSIIYPYHQNVIWTYVIGLMFIILLEEFKEQFGQLPMLIFSPVPIFLGYFLAEVLFTDYYGAGVLIILMFYLFRGRHWGCFLGQLVCLWFINLKLLGGYYYIIPFLGYNFEFIQQAFAVLSLLLIWLYYGRQGLHGKIFRGFCYLFYPVYMLVLFVVRFKLLY